MALSKSHDAAPSVLTIAEVAKVLRIGKNQAYEAARRGDIHTIRIGNRLLVPRVWLDGKLSGGGTTG